MRTSEAVEATGAPVGGEKKGDQVSWKARLLLGAVTLTGLWLLGGGSASAQTAEESCFTSRINGARERAGLSPYETNADLAGIARTHSQKMAESGTIYHSTNLASVAPRGWKSLGENVGMGPTCDAIHNAFMNSPSHRANVLEPKFAFVGVGVVIASNTIFVTEVFMQASQPAPGEPAPTNTSPATEVAPGKAASPKVEAAAPTHTEQPPAAEPPPPPAAPGSKVTGRTASYLDVLEREVLLSEAERAEYQAYLEEQAAVRARKPPAPPRGFLARLAAFFGTLFSGAS